VSIRSGLLLAGATLVQVTLIGRLDPVLPAPNLVLALCAARAWTRGGRAGMSWALAGGLLLDLAGAVGPLGVHALAMLTAAYAAGLLAAAFENSSTAASSLAGAVAGIVYGAVVLGAADTLGLAAITLRAALPLIAGGAVMSAVATAVATAGLRRWAGARDVVPQWQ
jgi:rod shape-determining protein MreD